MIDAELSLAFSMHSGKGVYALLLGSGISRSASIPTGWEVLEDLIRKLAHACSAPPLADPSAWYRTTIGEEPDYSKLLAALCQTPAARQQLLRGYFEATEDERVQGKKLPTAAHHAIAELVARGYVRVIITTNFDRLLEQALTARGVTPMVISTPDAVSGALPLAHSKCTIVKIHGDYADVRLLNTPEEVSKYDQRLETLLAQIFDEYGLIVSGWSATWDQALSDAMTRCPTRRFPMYWTAVGSPTEEAERLITFRQAHIIKVSGADEFFMHLKDKVIALEEYDSPHPLSTKSMVAMAKRFIQDHRDIDLNDLVVGSVERMNAATSHEHFNFNRPGTLDEYQRRIKQYEAIAEISLQLLVIGSYWSDSRHDHLWTRCIEHAANSRRDMGGLDIYVNLRHYPALLLFYGAGIAALAARKYERFYRLLMGERIVTTRTAVPAIQALIPKNVLDNDTYRNLPGTRNTHTPLSDHLHSVLRDSLQLVIADDSYDDLFDRFEYLRSLVSLAGRNEDMSTGWVPMGRFVWRGRYAYESTPMFHVNQELEREGEAWPLLAAGLCGKSLEEFRQIKKVFDERIGHHAKEMG